MEQTYEIKNIKVTDLEINKGQIFGLPKNPRFIRDERYNALKHSIEEAPEMLGLRELLVYPYEGKNIVIGGNMRLRACLDLGYAEIPCKVLPEETPVAKLREYVIKDNESFGQNDWDILANEWDAAQLTSWGVDLPIMESEINTDEFFDSLDNEEEKSKGEKLTITIPDEYADQKDEMKSLIESALSDYSGIKVK